MDTIEDKQVLQTEPVKSTVIAELPSQEVRKTPEETLKSLLDVLRSILSEPGCPRFSEFWKVRRDVLSLFKENIPVKSRAEFWKEFASLSVEARNLKEILDEKSAFAVEQIELAVLSVEKDLENLPILMERIEEDFFLGRSLALKHAQEFYLRTQKEIQLLSSFASKVQGLRTELIKTGMRVKIKNQLFERLSLCGDKIFPRRKELVQKLSDAFLEDVTCFAKDHFSDGDFGKVPLYVLREEIKELQAIAKDLFLNPSVFSHTRTELSSCWDKLKEKEKERKISLTHKKEEEKKLHEEDLERHRLLQEQEQARKLKVEGLKSSLEALLARVETEETAKILLEKDQLVREIPMLQITRVEKGSLDQIVGRIKHALTAKKEKAWMNLPEGVRHDFDVLNTALEEGKNRRQEIKTELEGYRKALGSSGFDFEKAMMYRELIETEKAALDKVNAAIEEIEQKIAEIEG